MCVCLCVSAYVGGAARRSALSILRRTIYMIQAYINRITRRQRRARRLQRLHAGIDRRLPRLAHRVRHQGGLAP